MEESWPGLGQPGPPLQADGFTLLHSPPPAPLKKELPRIRHLAGAVNVKFKFILCTTFDFREDYTSAVKGGPSLLGLCWALKHC